MCLQRPLDVQVPVFHSETDPLNGSQGVRLHRETICDYFCLVNSQRSRSQEYDHVAFLLPSPKQSFHLIGQGVIEVANVLTC